MFFIVAGPLNIATSNAQEFQFLHILLVLAFFLKNIRSVTDLCVVLVWDYTDLYIITI